MDRKNFATENLQESPVTLFKLAGAGVTYNNELISIRGKKLRVLFENANFRNFEIKLNSIDNHSIIVTHNMTLIAPFERLYFFGSVRGTIYFYAFKEPEFDIIIPENHNWGGLDSEALAAATAKNIERRLMGIYVETVGNLVVNYGGLNATITGVPAGTFLPISPSAIVAAGTTATMQLIYVDSPYVV